MVQKSFLLLVSVFVFYSVTASAQVKQRNAEELDFTTSYSFPIKSKLENPVFLSEALRNAVATPTFSLEYLKQIKGPKFRYSNQKTPTVSAGIGVAYSGMKDSSTVIAGLRNQDVTAKVNSYIRQLGVYGVTKYNTDFFSIRVDGEAGVGPTLVYVNRKTVVDKSHPLFNLVQGIKEGETNESEEFVPALMLFAEGSVNVSDMIEKFTNRKCSGVDVKLTGGVQTLTLFRNPSAPFPEATLTNADGTTANPVYTPTGNTPGHPTLGGQTTIQGQPAASNPGVANAKPVGVKPFATSVRPQVGISVVIPIK